MTFLNKKGKGIGLCFLIALPSWLLVRFIAPLQVVGAPIIAILIGMLIALILKNREPFQKGIAFTSKLILQSAVVLLGFGLNLATVAEVGWSSLPIIVSTIGTSLIIAFIFSKILSVPSRISVLIGVGSSICGGSAIAATAPVVRANDEEIAQAISVIFFFNVIAALIFPTLGGLLGLTNEGFGLFAGTAVNDTSSVTAAASTWDTLHQTNGAVLEYATIVKLTRTLAIIPITLILSLYEMRKMKKENKEKGSVPGFRKMFPMFILWFIVASLITTVLTAVLQGETLAVAESVFAFLKEISKFLIVMAMAAIGLNTNIVKLIRTGGKPILLGFLCWFGIACVSLLMQHVIGIW